MHVAAYTRELGFDGGESVSVGIANAGAMDGWTLLGLMLAIVSIFLTVLVFIVPIYQKAISDEASTDRKRLLARLYGTGGWVTTYEIWLKSLLNWLDRFFEQTKNETLLQPRYLTARSFDRCLLLALIYPFASAVLGWFIFGEAGALGEAINLFPERNELVRGGWAAYVCLIGWILAVLLRRDRGLLALGALVGAFFLPIWLGFDMPPAVAFVLVGASAFAGAFLIAGAVAFSDVGAFSAAGGGTFAFAFAFVGAANFTSSGVFAFVCVAAWASLNTLSKPHRPHVHWRVLVPLIVLASAGIFILAHMGWLDEDVSNLARIIGLILLPLVNVVFDFFSIGLTRFCLRRSLYPAGQSLLRRAGWALLDMAGALVFMAGLCIAIVFVLEGFNAAVLHGGFAQAPIPVSAQISEIASEGLQGKHFWLVFALFSTLLPTVLHLMIFCASLFSNLLGQNGRNQRLADAIRTPEALEGGSKATWLALLVALQWPLAILVTIGAVYWLYVAALHTPGLGSAFLGLMDWSLLTAQAVFDG